MCVCVIWKSASAKTRVLNFLENLTSHTVKKNCDKIYVIANNNS